MWQWFLEPSLYGTEVLTLGGSRGPSVSYYVPYLSAMQLLLPVASSQPSQQPGTASMPASDMPAAPQVQLSEAQLSDAHQTAAQQAQTNLAGQSQQADEAAPARAGKLYHIMDDWQHWSRQVIPANTMNVFHLCRSCCQGCQLCSCQLAFGKCCIVVILNQLWNADTFHPLTR